MDKFLKLFDDVGETKNYMQALELIEKNFPTKDNAWVIQTTDTLLEMMMELSE